MVKKRLFPKEQYKELFVSAERDYKVACISIKNSSLNKGYSASDNLLDTAAYHVEQACEKILKGYLVYNEKEIEYSHDLTKIYNECVKNGLNFNNDINNDLA